MGHERSHLLPLPSKSETFGFNPKARLLNHGCRWTAKDVFSADSALNSFWGLKMTAVAVTRYTANAVIACLNFAILAERQSDSVEKSSPFVQWTDFMRSHGQLLRVTVSFPRRCLAGMNPLQSCRAQGSFRLIGYFVTISIGKLPIVG